MNEKMLQEKYDKLSQKYFDLKDELNAIMESTPDIIYSVDKHGNFLSVNSVFLKTFNLTKPDIIGKNVKDLKKQGIYQETVCLIAAEEKKPVTLTQEIQGTNYLISAYPMITKINKNSTSPKEEVVNYVVTKIRNLSELEEIKGELDSVKKVSQNYYNELKVLRNRTSNTKDIIAQSVEMKRIIDLAKRVALVDTTVVINGDSGTGKEVIAKLVHNTSSRKNGPFIKINCGAIPENLLESELFGYEKGAFTGAGAKGKAGLFEIANKGSLLLDEIGDMPLALQVKLLRVLQEGEFYPVGAVKPIQSDVRIIASTNRNLKDLVEKGKFREDLYYRLNVIKLLIPPLRERKEDIIPLVYFFLNKYNEKYKFNKTIDSDIIDILYNGYYKGNVRELENTVERLVVTSTENNISTKCLPGSVLNQLGYENNVNRHNISNLKETVDRFEYDLIMKAYENNGKDINKTAQSLNVHRTTILRKIKKFEEENNM